MLRPVPFLTEMSRFGLDHIASNDAKTCESPECIRRRAIGIVDLSSPVDGKSAHLNTRPLGGLRLEPSLPLAHGLPCGSMVETNPTHRDENLKLPDHNGMPRAK